MSAKGLNKGIVEFYDESAGTWEDVWGEHMHHGFYDPGSVSGDLRSAQIRMIEEALLFASVPVAEEAPKKPRCIVDVGCGIGASSIYLSRKYGAECYGIDLSPVQIERAQALAATQGLADKVKFLVADALEQPFPDGKFDLVWVMESGEHIPESDRQKFVSELGRVAAPGGTIIITTGCHRDLSPTEESLRPEEKRLLETISDALYFPPPSSTADYIKLLESLSLKDVKTADWSENAAPFWPAMMRSVMKPEALTTLLKSGWKSIQEVLVIPFLIEGYDKGVIKYSIITARKPE